MSSSRRQFICKLKIESIFYMHITEFIQTEQINRTMQLSQSAITLLYDILIGEASICISHNFDDTRCSCMFRTYLFSTVGNFSFDFVAFFSIRLFLLCCFSNQLRLLDHERVPHPTDRT